MNKSIKIIISLIVIAVVAIAAAMIGIHVFDKSEKEESILVGSWEMEKEYSDKYGTSEIRRITFLSDGTCIVGGLKGKENGRWEIVDEKLKVVGESGGMFWNYTGFLCSFELDGDVLIIYDDDGTILYKYNRNS